MEGDQGGIDLDAVALPCTRDTIQKEYADGDLAVRILIDASEAETFWTSFPDIDDPCYLANGYGAVECVRSGVMQEYRDGSLAVRLLFSTADKGRFRKLWPKPGEAAVLVREAPDAGRRAMQEATAQPRGALRDVCARPAATRELHGPARRMGGGWFGCKIPGVALYPALRGL